MSEGCNGVIVKAVVSSSVEWRHRLQAVAAALAHHPPSHILITRITQKSGMLESRIFFRWEPAPILVCVEDLTEDLDYVSKKCTSTTRLPYSLHSPLLSFTKQGGRTPKSKPRIFSSDIRETPPSPSSSSSALSSPSGLHSPPPHRGIPALAGRAPIGKSTPLTDYPDGRDKASTWMIWGKSPR
jgi:hypothetical protein